MKNNISSLIPKEFLEPERMIKINVFTGAEFRKAEVCEELYKILQEKVIKSLTHNLELQIFLQESKITLERFMESSITEKMLTEAINEIQIK